VRFEFKFFSLPESTPRWFFVALVALLLAGGTLKFLPELRALVSGSGTSTVRGVNRPYEPAQRRDNSIPSAAPHASGRPIQETDPDFSIRAPAPIDRKRSQ
jgi:hypothetical protein